MKSSVQKWCGCVIAGLLAAAPAWGQQQQQGAAGAQAAPAQRRPATRPAQPKESADQPWIRGRAR